MRAACHTRSMKRTLFWISLGAVLAWFADPVSGPQRRKAISDLMGRAGTGRSTGSPGVTV